MRKKIVLFAVVLTMVVSFAGIAVGAGNVLIDTLGAAFLSEDNSYVPLRSVGGFLGAQLKWDAAKGQAVLTYNGQDLALTPSNTNAVFQGQPVVLSSPPVVVRGVTYIPASALKQFYNVPVEWDAARSEVKIKGPTGWGTMKVQSRPPWHGGPPPWAPAWGERRKQGVRNPQAPGNNQQQNKGEGQQIGAAFLSGDNSYVPLRSVGGFLGAQLKWDAAKGQAVITYNGQDLALTPSNMNAVFQGQPVLLSSPPVVVRGVTYIPASALKQFYNVPVEWDAARSEVKIKGPTGWGTMKAQSRPPWHGGPPPWAPAWGERRKQGVHNPQAPGNNQQQNKGEGQQKGQAKGK